MSTGARRSALCLGLAALFAAVLCSALTLYVSTRPTQRVLKTWACPAAVPYCPGLYLSVLEGAPDLDGFPFYIGRRYAIYVGRESGQPSYGHRLDYRFNAEVVDIETHLARTVVRWMPEGVSLTEPSGHALFIPKTAFLNAR